MHATSSYVRSLGSLVLMLFAVCVPPAEPPNDNGQTGDQPPEPTVAAKCGACHVQLMEKFNAGSHANVDGQCLICHPNGEEHRLNWSTVRAAMDFSLEACAACHRDQYTTYLEDDGSKAGHFGGSIKTSKYQEFPYYQYLMGGHGFTREYNEERAHKFILRDHVDIERRKTTTCLQCKSTAVAYFWNETRRDQVQFHKGMDWESVIAGLEQQWPDTVDYGAGCTHCHDPHNGDFRVIRKGVIEAIAERGTDPYNPELNVIPANRDALQALMNERGSDGQRTAQALRLAGTLTCGQCHIEYVCGQGADRDTTGEIRDHVPWRKLTDIEEHYQAQFGNEQDWRHSITGLTGVKPQHPELESYWDSTHHRQGLSCADCHMEKRAGHTSHWLTSPLKYENTRCNECHDDVTDLMLRLQEGIYEQARDVEDLLLYTLEGIEQANTDASIPPEQLDSAKSLFMRALTWWEWTAVSENSMGVHNWAAAADQLDMAEELATEARSLVP